MSVSVFLRCFIIGTGENVQVFFLDCLQCFFRIKIESVNTLSELLYLHLDCILFDGINEF